MTCRLRRLIHCAVSLCSGPECSRPFRPTQFRDSSSLATQECLMAELPPTTTMFLHAWDLPSIHTTRERQFFMAVQGCSLTASPVMNGCCHRTSSHLRFAKPGPSVTS